MDYQEIHQQLLDPAAYPEPTGSVAFIETHISRVYLTETRAYKLKKPLNLGFLDFSTLERRGFFCTEEVRLNRRFAPDIYLGVAELRSAAGVLHFDGPGTLIDFAVRMRRLPEARMLDRLIEGGSAELPGEIERLARHLVPLLAAARPCRDVDGDGSVAAIRANCKENLDETAAAIGHALTAQAHRTMATLTSAQLAQLAPLLRDRQARGCVRDGHGDLHARNICMTEPIQIYDCIEFCRRFRVADVAAELAFLLMDLEFRSRRDLAERFLNAYQEHAADPELATLLPFFKGYRAWVRGKVEALLADEAEVAAETRQQALERSRRYFNLALGYQVPPMLLLTAGLMGVGKTTLARALATALGAELLRSDVIRKELAGIPVARSSLDAFDTGLYTPEMSRCTYTELRQRAERLLRLGKTVIVDASFARSQERQAFFALAGKLALPLRVLHVHCHRATAIGRLAQRQAHGQDASDGRAELVDAQAAAFEPPDSGPELITIDSSGAVDYNVQEVICQLLTR
jgi:aminoglycoside phosphotransferase family enzyme/predicted kinase